MRFRGKGYYEYVHDTLESRLGVSVEEEDTGQVGNEILEEITEDLVKRDLNIWKKAFRSAVEPAFFASIVTYTYTLERISELEKQNAIEFSGEYLIGFAASALGALVVAATTTPCFALLNWLQNKAQIKNASFFNSYESQKKIKKIPTYKNAMMNFYYQAVLREIFGKKDEYKEVSIIRQGGKLVTAGIQIAGLTVVGGYILDVPVVGFGVGIAYAFYDGILKNQFYYRTQINRRINQKVEDYQQEFPPPSAS